MPFDVLRGGALKVSFTSLRRLSVPPAVLFLLLSFGAFAQQPPTDADVSLTKSGPATAAADSDVSYDLVVTNLGPAAADTVVLNDNIPAGMTFVSATQVNGTTIFTCTDPGVGNPGTVSCSVGSLPNGESAQFTFVFHIDPATAPDTTFTNIAFVSAKNDPNDENNEGVAATSVPGPPPADLQVTKTGPAKAGPDTDVVYSITLTNVGPGAATNVSLNDTLPGNLTFVSLAQNSGQALSCTGTGTIICTAASFAVGTATFTLTAHVPSGTAGGTSVQNTVSVSADNDFFDEDNSSTTFLTVSSADVSVAKQGPPVALAGTNVLYTIVVTNNGPDTALNVTLVDNLPAGTTFVSAQPVAGPPSSCTGPAVGSGGTVVCGIGLLPSQQSAQFNLTINAGGATSISNTASVTTDTFDPNGTNDSATAVTAVTPVADVSVSKSGPSTAVQNSNVVYSVTVANAGPSAATNVSVSDVAPAQTTFVSVQQTTGPAFSCVASTCTAATMAAGASATFQFTFGVNSNATGTISNTATVTATEDSTPLNNTSTVTAPVVAIADLSVTKTGPASAIQDTDISYDVTVANAGPSNATTVSLNDPTPAQTTFVSVAQLTGPAFTCATSTCNGAALAAGASATFRFTFHVNVGAIGTITNTATVTAPEDSNAVNNSGTATTIVGVADVSVTKTGPPTAAQGRTVVYDVTIANAGPITATAVSLSDPAPAQTTFVSVSQTSGPAFTCTTSTCTAASLAAGASATFRFTFQVNAGATGSLSNTATVTAVEDPNLTNNTSTATSAIVADVPALSPIGLALLAIALAMVALYVRGS